MSNIQDENYGQILSYLKRQNWQFDERIENNGDVKRIDIHHGKYTCIVKIYKTGSILVQGKDSKLKENLQQIKEAIENEEPISDVLPFEIERFPELLTTNIPNIDPVIVRFIQEAINSLKTNSLLACAFLLGAASEKAIFILVETYANAIKDPQNREKFISRYKGRFISKVFDEFKRSFKSCKNKPTGYNFEHDLEIKIETIFQFSRICRNEVGHPQITPNLDKGVLLANMGQFVKYMEDVYSLIEYFKNNEIIL